MEGLGKRGLREAIALSRVVYAGNRAERQEDGERSGERRVILASLGSERQGT
jgi:hypothetical protein